MSGGAPEDSTSSPVGTGLRVVGATDPDCPHPTAALEELGSDRVNDYFHCVDSTGVVVLARATTLAAEPVE